MQCEQKKCSNIYRKPKLKLEEGTLSCSWGGIIHQIRNLSNNSWSIGLVWMLKPWVV